MGGALEMVSLIREGLHEQSFFFLPRKKPKERLTADLVTQPIQCVDGLGGRLCKP